MSLYKWALNRKCFFATVNSEALIDYYNSYFKCGKEKFFLVYDAMTLTSEESMTICRRDTYREPYIFFGGKAFRDVDTFCKIVKLLPKIRFKAVILKAMITPEMKNLKNLEVLHDIDRDKFNNILCNASLCCIPLSATIPCGLSVMQKAMLMGIPIISTDTPSMKTIIPNDDYGFLLSRGDSKGMASKIITLLNNKELYDKIVENGHKRMMKFSPENVGKQLIDVLDNLNNNNHA